MIDLTVPAGQQPTDILHAVIADTLDRTADLGAAGAAPPQLTHTIERVKHAQERNDRDALPNLLRDVAVAAVAARVLLLSRMGP